MIASSPPPILSPWTILNDDHGDYVLVIPARSLKECPCCVLNTQRRDYADPYMWCCGCIPPVRLNPICYRFGLKEERCSKQAGGEVEGCAGHIHTLQYIPLLLYHGGSELNLPLEVVFLSVCIRTLKKRKNIGLCQGYTLYYFSLNLSFSPSFFIFPLWSRQSQIPIQLPLECGSN